MAITTDDVKKLRDETGISIMQCKKALEEAGGDMEKARIILEKQSKAAASKKADRALGAGAVASYVHNTGTVGAMVLLLCETDFVARNEEFKMLAYELAMQVAATAPDFLSIDMIADADKAKAREVFLEEVKDKPAEMQDKILQGKLDSFFKEKALLDQAFIKDQSVTIREMLERGTQKFGEKIEIGSFSRLAV